AGAKLPYIRRDGRRVIWDPTELEIPSFEEWSEDQGRSVPDRRKQEEYLRFVEQQTPHARRGRERVLESDRPITLTPEYRDALAEARGGGRGGGGLLGGRSFMRRNPLQSRMQTAGVSDMGDVYDAFRGATQGAFIAMDAPVQEVQGLVRSAYGLTHGEGLQLTPQSDLAIMLQTGA